MIVHACFVPHPPLLIPEVGKDNINHLKETREAYQKIETELYARKPDILLVISSHSPNKNSFSINQQPKVTINFKRFGDLVTNLEFKNDIALGYKIKESTESEMPIILSSEQIIDYGAGVPLFYLANHLPNCQICIVHPAKELDYADHIKFGELIKEQLVNYGKRIAVIAAGDLSHRLHQDSPAGYSPRAQEFDQKLIKILAEKDFEGLIKFDKFLAEEAKECAIKPLLVLMGIMKDINFESEKLSYQAPFGIGYLVENFSIK
jgi:aromatic ring-opening dioxygenase LigB subunit